MKINPPYGMWGLFTKDPSTLESIRTTYEAGKADLLDKLMVKSADATVYRYTGSTPTQYERVLAYGSSSALREWSARTAVNRKLHLYHAAHSHTPKLVKVTFHHDNSRFSGETMANNEMAVHIAMTEMQSRYVPMLFDARMYRVAPRTCVVVMVMRLLTGITLDAMYVRRRQQAGFKYVLAHEKKQLEEALKDLWSVGCAHQDLHLNNIMLTRDGHLYVIDFSRSWSLGRAFYTQKLTFAEQKRRIRAILGRDELHSDRPIPVMNGVDSMYNVASKLHAYPEYFAMLNMRSRPTQGRVDPRVRAVLAGVRRARANVARAWKTPTSTTWKRLAHKRRLERRLNSLYGITQLI